MPAPRTLPKHTLIVCPKCQVPTYLPDKLDAEVDLPVYLKCPKCQEVTVTFDKEIPLLPKVAPAHSLAAQYWLIMQPGTQTVDDPLEDFGKEPANRLATMFDRSLKMEELMLAGLQELEQIQNDKDTFQKAYYDSFVEQIRQAREFQTNWDVRYLSEWIKYPMWIMPMLCGTKLQDAYTRVVMAPRWYRPDVGFPVFTHGAGYMQVVNAYSRMNCELTNEQADYFGVPRSIDLQVMGAKIVGSSLAHCWQDIPGTMKDYDHTDICPSIRIRPEFEASHEARAWLASHGVVPWQARPIRKEIIRQNHNWLGLNDSPFKPHLEKVCMYGRLGIFSENYMQLRAHTVAFAYCFQGLKMVLLSDEADKSEWSQAQSPLIIKNTAGGELCFLGPGEAYRPEQIEQLPMVIIDDRKNAIEIERLLPLYQYPGVILYLGREPVMDALGDNYYASMVHALCGYEAWEIGDKDWPASYYYDSPLLKALRYQSDPTGYPAPNFIGPTSPPFHKRREPELPEELR